MAGLFSKSKKKAAGGAKKKGVVWKGDEVGEAVHELVRLNAEKKAIDAKMKLWKADVKRHADRCFVKDFAALGVMPESPMRVQNADGEQVTYVVQDRSGSARLTDDQVGAIHEVLGDESDVVGVELSIQFNRAALANPKVFKAVEQAVERVANKLVKEGLIEEPSDLVDVEEVTRLKPGTLSRAALVTGNDVVRLEEFLDVVQGSVVRYVKV